MKKILYMLLCIFMLIGCTQQTGGNTGSSSTTTSNTDPVVTTASINQEVTDDLTNYEMKLGYLGFDCSNSDIKIYNINNNSGRYFKITLNPDGNHWVSLNFSVGDGTAAYFGSFKLIEDNVFSVEFEDFLEEHINADPKIEYKAGPDAYFKLEDDKLYYITETFSINEIKNYSSDNYCKLIPVL